MTTKPLGLLFLIMVSLSGAFADGGRVVASATLSEGRRATVMALPWPLVAGPADVGVFVQDADGNPVLGAEVSFEWAGSGSGEEWVPPCCRMKSSGGPVSASLSHGQNRLVYSADLTIPGSGPGVLRVIIRNGSREDVVEVAADAKSPPPPALAYLPWLAMTPLAIGAYVLHQYVVRGAILRRKSRSGA